MITAVKLFLFILAVFFSRGSLGQSFYYHGRLTDNTGAAIVSTNVEFKVDITDPMHTTCVIAEETYAAQDLSTSNGYFTINVGTGTTSAGSATIVRAFQNLDPLLNCIGSGTYTPASGDGRGWILSFSLDGGTTWEAFPAEFVNSVPFAMDSNSVGGFSSSTLLRVADASGNPQAASALSPANLINLLALINGTSTQYVPSTATGGATMPSYTTALPPSAPLPGDVWYDRTANTLKFYNGTSIQTVGSGGGGGGISSLTVDSNLTVNGTVGGTLNGPGTIALNPAGITTGTVGATAITASSLTATGNVSGANLSASGNVTAGNISAAGSLAVTQNISGANVSAGGGSFRTLLLNDSTNTAVTLQTQTTIPAAYSLTLPASPPGTSGYMLTSDTNGNLSWAAPVVNAGNAPEFAGRSRRRDTRARNREQALCRYRHFQNLSRQWSNLGHDCFGQWDGNFRTDRRRDGIRNRQCWSHGEWGSRSEFRDGFNTKHRPCRDGGQRRDL